jgi:hypothetical protein
LSRHLHHGALGAVLALELLLLVTPAAQAVPSFAQQTGQPCTACHIGAFGPQLTPFGRAFKIGGYTQTGGDGIASQIPLAAFIQSSFTHTNTPQPQPPANDFGNNNNPAINQISVFLAGRLTDYAGGFVQTTWSGTDRSIFLDNTDLRLTMPLSLGDSELRVGLSLNNGPGVQDAYNSSPIWRFPFISSSLAPTPAAQPLLTSGLVGNSIGLTAYAWYDRRLYLEAGGYASFGPTLLSAAGAALGPGSTANIAPYVRVAYEWNWNAQSAHVGGLVLSANFNPATSAFTVDGSQGRNSFTDTELDGGYQYLGDGTHIVTFDASFVHEGQNQRANFNTSAASQAGNALNQVNANVSYFYQNTYGLTLGWQYTWGNADPLLYPAAPLTGSRNGSPDSNAFIIEADWIPFGKDTSWGRPFANLKLGLQYTIYTLFNGGNGNYDNFGRAASDNNTLFLFAWLAF